MHRLASTLGRLPLSRLGPLVALCGLVAIAVAAYPVHSYGGWVADLQAYREGSRAWWHGGDLYGPLPGTPGGATPPFLYPPFALFALTPFTVPPLPSAIVVTVVVTVAALAVTAYVVARWAWPDAGRRGAAGIAALTTPVFLLFDPLRENLGLGQVNVWLMALVAVDCLSPRTRWPRGLLVGLAAAIKVTPAAFLLFFLLRKDFRAAGTAAIAGSLATGLGFLVAPTESARFFFGGVLADGTRGNLGRETNQSLTGALTRLGLPGGWHWALLIILIAAVLVAAVLVTRRASPPLALVVNAVAALLCCPLSWSAHWVWIIPALLILASHATNLAHRLGVLGSAALFAGGPQRAFAPRRHLDRLAVCRRERLRARRPARAARRRVLHPGPHPGAGHPLTTG
ncbi:glycosyltransferase 87 family protein [Amycolatopsis samaneae]|uniref:Glycosyltransferase 87 family protein n=1 Tax=Amycolatopsis samaneae TaxID=664691 RepID=A0ABW5G7P5_9PSEU